MECLRRARSGEREESYLNASGSHLQLGRKFVSKGGIGLGIPFEDAFKDLELGAGGPLPMFDLVGGVWVESSKVDGCGVHDWGLYEGGNWGKGIA